MLKKVTYLFLALALPGLIFVFLKFFGKNEFNIPIYFENGIVEDSVCSVSSKVKYAVQDSIIARGKGATVVIIYPFVGDDLSEINRVQSKYNARGVNWLILSGIQNLPKSGISTQFLDYTLFGNVVTCHLRIQEPWSVVLLDSENAIRGFYDGRSREEIDRLDGELKILLKQY